MLLMYVNECATRKVFFHTTNVYLMNVQIIKCSIKESGASTRQLYHSHINTPMYLHRVSTLSRAVAGKTARCR